MNILFIFSLQDYQNLVKPLQNQESIQFGISYISSFLKSKGHNTDLFIFTRETKKKDFDVFLKKFSPELICFTSVATEYNVILKIARYIKNKFPNIYLLMGGCHVSLNPEKAIVSPFDAICIGEGEYPTLELVKQLKKGQKPSKINNLWIKSGKRIEKNPTRNFIQDLDSLPFPDREMWQRWISYPDTKQVVFLGRGCPFQCTYCCNHKLQKLANGKYVRFRSASNVLKEIKEVIKRFPKTKEIYLEVETIGVNMKFALELCSELEKLNRKIKNPLTFGVNLRIMPNIDYNEFFTAFKKANFSFINIGLESGSKKIRENILKRHYSNEDIIKTVKLAKKHELKISTFNLIGIPGETLTDFKETIKCNRECQPDWTHLSVFFPYTGTELYKVCNERGLLKDNIDTRMERRKAILDLPGFSKKQIQKQFNWFYYNVYKGYRPLYVTLGRVVFLKIHSNHLLNSIYRKLTSYPFFKKIELLFRGY